MQQNSISFNDWSDDLFYKTDKSLKTQMQDKKKAD